MAKATDRDLSPLLTETIRENEPVTVESYMSACLSHYYGNRDPLGVNGDFITAPEISQIFGELIGLWCAETWRLSGSPANIKLIELGPGRGTLMNDALRAIRAVPKFYNTLEVHLVEINDVLRDKQADLLAEHRPSLAQHYSLDEIPEGPAIIIANEFFDAIPVRQFQYENDKWFERCVTQGHENAFRYSVRKEADTQISNIIQELLPASAPSDGDVFEYREQCKSIMDKLAGRERVAGLIIDYGHETSGYGDTLQAVRSHKYANPLETPGQADLTTQVDFNQFTHFSRKSGLKCSETMTQGQFLLMLGLEQRLKQLMSSASPDQAEQLKSGAIRLVAPDQMGALFKVMSFISPDIPNLPPFAQFG